jgi:hypothetical protein
LTTGVTLDFDQRQLLGLLTDFLEQREDNVEVYHFARVWPETRPPPLLEDHEEGEAIDEDQQRDSPAEANFRLTQQVQQTDRLCAQGS